VEIGVEQGLAYFIDQLEGHGEAGADWYEVFHAIGAGEMREGRSLDALHSALRLAARVAWRRLLGLIDHTRVSSGTVGAVAEATFAYLDEIAKACAAGYAHAQAAEVGEVERRRRRLIELLLTTPPASSDEITAAAQAARWPVPRRLLVVAVDEEDMLAYGVPVLAPQVLVGLDRAVPCLLVPDPDSPSQARSLVAGLARWLVAVGPPVPPADAAHALGWAHQALRLARRGVLDAGPEGTLWCQEHLATLAIFQDEHLLGALAARSLAPLDGIRASQRDVLADTLLVWLQRDHNANEVAALLHVHPQTVRYRMRQLDRLFAAQLRDPEERLALEIALRADRVRRLAKQPAEPA
jgi:hypothetical protein